MFIATKKQSIWTEECEVGASTSESLSERPCRQLSIRDVLMYNNTATNAGGAMFASDAKQVHYSKEVRVVARLSPTCLISSCLALQRDSSLHEIRYQRLSEMEMDEKHADNEVGLGGYGNQFASNAVRLAIVSPKIVPSVDGRNLLVQNHSSGTPLPPIKFRVVDAFKNTITGGIADSSMPPPTLIAYFTHCLSILQK